MNITDPIADYITRVRNAIQARHKRVDIPASGVKREITRVLLKQNYIAGFTEVEDKKQGLLRVALRYTDGVSAISGLTRVSTPGLRVYLPADKLPRVMNGLGVALVSTSKGIMTDRDARTMHVGGEVLCEIW